MVKLRMKPCSNNSRIGQHITKFDLLLLNQDFVQSEICE